MLPWKAYSAAVVWLFHVPVTSYLYRCCCLSRHCSGTTYCARCLRVVGRVVAAGDRRGRAARVGRRVAGVLRRRGCRSGSRLRRRSARAGDLRGPQVEVVAVDVDPHAAVGLVVPALVLLHPAVGQPPVTADVRRAGVGLAVPVRDPDLVGHGQRAVRGDSVVVHHPDARRGTRVVAGRVAEVVQLAGPGGEVPQRRVRAGRAGPDVEGLEVVEQRAAPDDAQTLRGVDGLARLGPALAARGVVGVRGGRDDRGVDVLAVPRVARRAGRLRPERDRHQVPAGGELVLHPGRGQVRLRAAGTGVAGDVDAGGPERRLLDPGRHRGLARGVALVEAVAGEVARGDRVGGVRRRAGQGAEQGRDQAGCHGGGQGSGKHQNLQECREMTMTLTPLFTPVTGKK